MVGLIAVGLALLAGLALLPADRVAAQGFTVTREDDTVPDDCSLREAIVAANLDPDNDVITVPAGVYVLEIGIDGDGAALTADQRGTARPQGNACDVGAFERVVSVPPSGNGDGGEVVTPTPTPTPTPIVGAGAPPPTPVLELRGFAPRGVALWVLLGGASTADLIASLADSGADPNGCTVASIVAGQWVVLIPGALDQRVNAAWLAAFPSGIADGTPLWSRCS